MTGKCAPNFDDFPVIKIANLADGLVSLDAAVHNFCVTNSDVPPTWEGSSEASHDIAA